VRRLGGTVLLFDVLVEGRDGRAVCGPGYVEPGSQALRAPAVTSQVREHLLQPPQATPLRLPSERAAVDARCRYLVGKSGGRAAEDTVHIIANILCSAIKRKYNRNMQLRYNYRLYPTPRQRETLARAFGCARVVFNDALCARQEAFAAGLPYPTDAELSARLTAAKASPERALLGEVSAVVLQQALADLNAAYRNFFASLAGRRKGAKIAPPRFRSRKDRRQAIRFTRNARFSITSGGRLRLPKIGGVPVRWSRDLIKLAQAHARVADARREFHHQLSTALIRENQAVAVEDLAVKALARTRMAKSVHDAGWSAFVHMLEYKARLYGREFRRIGRFEPTSQVCSACGANDGPKPLHIRTWRCPRCGAWLDRDINAAVNVARAAGLAVTACGAQVRPGMIPAQRGEAGTHPKPRRDAA